MRLDKFIQLRRQCGKSTARTLIAQGKVSINGATCCDNLVEVTQFDTIYCANELIQQNEAHYIMLNKPAGWISATKDDQHHTVIDLIHENFAPELHIAGRLDKESTGLLILTNDGTWSRLLTEPVMAIPKRYLITTESNIPANTAEIFHAGIYFAYEDITTHPAELEILSPKRAIITIYEGKYHQIKRMFHAIGNRITSLHRLSIGSITLDATLAPGKYRALTEQELKSVSDSARNVLLE